MRTRGRSFVGGEDAQMHAPSAGSRGERRRRRGPSPRARHDDGHWTARKSVLVALSGASALWSALFVALKLFRG